ncbi:MAG: T9SS type A sorting domain-containing protein, partial [Bacteroidota bacterium]
AYTVKVTNTVTGCSSIKTINLSVNKCLGLINTNEMIDHVSVYPNPSNGLLMIETEQVIDIKILDQLGKIILSKHISENSCSLNLSTLSNGIYFIQVNDGKKTKTLKWLKTD